MTTAKRKPKAKPYTAADLEVAGFERVPSSVEMDPETYPIKPGPPPDWYQHLPSFLRVISEPVTAAGNAPMILAMCEVAHLRPWAANPRRNDEAARRLEKLLDHHGYRVPAILDQHGTIAAGHTRRIAALARGITEVAVLVQWFATEADRAAFAVADNQAATWADWDLPLLKEIVTEIDTGEIDLDALVGFSDLEFGELFNEQPGDGKTDPDAVPELPIKPVTQRGDLWILGNHRLMCGDSTCGNDVKKLMAGVRAGLMNTDPPYGVSYANDERPNPGVAKPRVAKDDLSDDRLQAFLEAAFKEAKDIALVDSAAWYLWHAHLTQGFFAAAAAADVILHRQIIWVKPVLLLGRGQYHWKHEPCFMGWRKGHEPSDYGRGMGERDQTTVWEIDGVRIDERREFNHSTPKPVSLFEIPIIKHLKAGEACLDPFAGTGPQIIAAEKHGCHCYAMEIEPRYCDVIVKRWEQFTGKKAERVEVMA